jgi:hypothetical protein
MQRRILTGLIAAMLISGVAFASPSIPLQQGETSIGFDVANLKPSVNVLGLTADLGSTNTNSYYLQHGITDKITIGAESTKLNASNNGGLSADVKATDIYAQYKIDNTFSLIAGSRNYDATVGYGGFSTDLSKGQFLWGVNASTRLNDKLTGHAGYKQTSYESEWQVGLADQLAKNISLDLSYKHHDYSFGSAVDLTLSGVGLGMNYKF